jgi:hypothetical protein
VPYVLAAGDRNNMPILTWSCMVDIHRSAVQGRGRVEVATWLLGILFGEEVWLRR